MDRTESGYAIPPIGHELFDSQGVRWEVYLQEIKVPCVRLQRFDAAKGGYTYKDIPHPDFSLTD